MCTRAIWPDAGGTVQVGRNMDYGQDTGSKLWALPRGMSRDDGLGGKLTWESKFGSLIAGAYDLMSVDGLNDVRLSVNAGEGSRSRIYNPPEAVEVLTRRASGR